MQTANCDNSIFSTILSMGGTNQYTQVLRVRGEGELRVLGIPVQRFHSPLFLADGVRSSR
jgi:hypothetical protein